MTMTTKPKEKFAGLPTAEQETVITIDRETRRAREGESEDLADLVRRLLHFNWHGKIVTTHQMSILLRNLADARILTSTVHVSL